MKKILIIDDDPDLLEGQRIFLQGKGFDVHTADGTEQGLKALKSFRPDLILVDLMMEHYDAGFVFCTKVRQDPALTKIPIIMQTSAPQKLGFIPCAYDEKARSWMKADLILAKPVPLDDLLEKIEEYLGK